MLLFENFHLLKTYFKGNIVPIEITSGVEAWETITQNKYRRWPNRKNPERLYPITSVEAKQSFTLSKDDSFFCIGSCFAREIEKTLNSMDYTVLSVIDTLPLSSKKVKNPEQVRLLKGGVSNKYNLPTILNELEWALVPELKFEEAYLYQTIDGLFENYHLTGPDYTDDLETSLKIRQTMNSTFEKIKEATVVVITLGLSEVWFDKEHSLYLNRAPSKYLIHRYPQRFELHVLDYPESYAYLEKIYTLLTQHLSKGFKLLITLSPIPLFATFRSQDVITANSYSKALLRTVIEAFVADKKNVDYFASYELSTLSYPQLVWKDKDFRHVDSYFVDYIVLSVMMQYLDEDTHKEDKYFKLMLAKAKVLYRSGYTNEAKAILEKIPNERLNAQERIIKKTMHSASDEKTGNKIIKIVSFFERYGLKQAFKYITNNYMKTKSTQQMMGFVDRWDGQTLSGWVINNQRDIATVKIVIEGQKEPITVKATEYREDVKKATGIDKICGYSATLSIEKSQKLLIQVIEEETGKELHNSSFYSDKYFS